MTEKERKTYQAKETECTEALWKKNVKCVSIFQNSVAKSVAEGWAKDFKEGKGQIVEGLACHVKEFSLYSIDNKLLKISGLGRENYFVLES